VENIEIDIQETGRKTWIGLDWLSTGTRGNSCKHGEMLGVIKCGEFVG
jgi:hypothetical protein